MREHRAFLAIAALLVGATAAGAQTAVPTTRVLVLYSHAPEGPGVVAFTQHLGSRISAAVGAPVEYYREFLDLDRFAGQERWPQLARYFAEKYSGFRVDVIVTEGSAALQFARERLREFLPTVPVVFALALEPTPDPANLPPNVTGRIARLSFAATIAMARRLQPDAERIVIVGGLDIRDSLVVGRALADLAPLRDSLPIVVTSIGSYQALLANLRRLSSRTIVLLAFLRRDRNGQYFIPGEVLSSITNASAAPVYGVMGTWMGRGIVGGSLIDLSDEGTRTGDLVVRVLHRRNGAAMPPVEMASSMAVADWRQLQRWHLPESALPGGTTVLYREPTVWERDHFLILTTVGIIIAQALLIALILAERTRRRRAQRVIADQSAFEQMIAEFRTDAVRHAADGSPHSLEEALARLGCYAGASRVVLVRFSDAPNEPSQKLYWPDAGRDNAQSHGESRAKDVRLALPLLTDGIRVGALELYRSDERPWMPRMIDRLEACGEIIAHSIARERALRSIRQSEELNRVVLASLSAPIAIVDRHGSIIRANDAWREVMQGDDARAGGYEFIGNNYLDECRRAERLGCTEARDVRCGLEAVLERRQSSFRCEYHLPSPNVRWYELRVDPLEHSDGGAVATHLDITERRLAEIRAEEARRQITHMARVALIGELAASISHELRQPLTAIRSNAEAGGILLAKSSFSTNEARLIFREIATDSERAAEVMDHVRLLLRKEEAPTTEVDINDVCRRAVSLLHRDALLRRTALDLSLEPRLRPIRGDAVQLQQVVLNLALNALDAASLSSERRAVMVGTAVEGETVEISVRDTGPGLAPHVKGQLFEPFFSTKAQGLGMGLVIVRSIVERHRGQIRAENDSARGAVFRVQLPRTFA